jgi:hypothetical protein
MERHLSVKTSLVGRSLLKAKKRKTSHSGPQASARRSLCLLEEVMERDLAPLGRR